MMLPASLFLCLSAMAFAGPPVPSHRFSKDELQRYFGVDSDEKAPEYEIVYPEYATDDMKRSVGRSAIAALSLDVYVDAFGETLHMTVERDDSGIKPGLEVEYYTDEGIITEPVQTDCIYTGKVVGEADSLVSATTCEGLMAIAYHTSGPTYIEPLDDEHAYKRDIGRGLPHVAYKNKPKNGASCPVRSLRCTEGDIKPSSTKYLELAFVGDAVLYYRRGNTTQTSLTTLFNAVKNILQLDSLAGKKLVPKLVHMIILTLSKPGYRISWDLYRYLPSAAEWLDDNKYPSSDDRHWDNAVVLSGMHFNYGILGLAYVGACDSKEAVSVSSFLSFDEATDTAAHEIGHNLGMCHDSEGNSCPPSGYVMAAYENEEKIKPIWSSCSRRYYNSFVEKMTCYNDS
ncbi:A disintegrin and metalloproteinase with thrombospondin motifs 10-like [Acanthaster planci]|uniref:A disintegrin and metalloproteinase with thrombospondin motifs 10-like n=1 Tax=Acanthaster planci TaxID=133434 RepID=A0A8B7Z810_ACAPL|nr:A disintegrin and metalloproteinase with thrombospondin motifs 10-like [Acanthaster planci]